MFTIVYPKNSVKAAMYPALSLQYHFFKKGIKLALATESKPGAEVVMCECEGMEQGGFSVKTEGECLKVCANDLFGFIAASDYLVGELFADATEATVPNVSHTGAYTWEMLTEKTAGFRVMYHNVWSYDQTAVPRYYGSRGAAFEIAEIMAYRPDVVSFNEFVDEWRERTAIMELMEAAGYREVTPPEINRLMINPMFYNTKTVRYVEGSCHMEFYGSLMTDENNLAIAQDGRYYNDVPSRYRGVLAAVFEDIATGKRFGSAVTHLVPNAYSVNKLPTDGDPWRTEELSKAIPFLKKMSAEYHVPFLIGGDYNSPATLAACKVLEAAGFRDSHTTAADADNICSCHGYPVWCGELDNFVDYKCPGIENGTYLGYDRAIDHIFTIGGIDAKTYRVLCEKTILCSSDHSPVMLDFDVK
ncbi:MAG: hypothetical protein IKJ35_00840 [Clostridia bacterium]|nr:hypothetical protein [Clostridia bacterium]